MSNREDSCEARIAQHMESRDSDFAALLAIAAGEKVECAACDGTGEIDREGSWSTASAEWQVDHGEDDVRTRSAQAFLDDEDAITCPTCDGSGEHAPTYDGEVLDEEAAYDHLHEYPLGVSVKRVLRVDLSTGGPGDWLEIEQDSDDGEVLDVSYHFNDWFDHAERRVDTGSALWHYAEWIAELYDPRNQ